LHSAAFRRLSGKTQVFTDLGDYHRTRLTHTMEVASIARTIGRALRLNEDLIEALALLHDIGHPPFGHAGEDSLDEFLADEGGFSHNAYALTLVQEIERPYPAFPGLNLSREVLDGQRSRTHKGGSRPSPLLAAPLLAAPLLEVQVVDLADSITYDAHDLDDGVQLGWLELPALLELPLVRRCHESVREQFGDLDGRGLRQTLVHELINSQVEDLLNAATSMLRPHHAASAREVQATAAPLAPSTRMAAEKKELEKFLYVRLYRHPDLVRARRAAQEKLAKMAKWYCQRPDELPEFFGARCHVQGVRRSVVDYLAGMTDHFCLREYQRLEAGPG
jgi:dGTPase